MTRLAEGQVFKSKTHGAVTLTELKVSIDQVVLRYAQGHTEVMTLTQFTRQIVEGHYVPEREVSPLNPVGGAPLALQLTAHQQEGLRQRKIFLDRLQSLKASGQKWREILPTLAQLATRLQIPAPNKRTLQRWQEKHAHMPKSEQGYTPKKGGWRKRRNRLPAYVPVLLSILLRVEKESLANANVATLALMLNQRIFQHCQEHGIKLYRVGHKTVTRLLVARISWDEHTAKRLDPRTRRRLQRRAGKMHDAERPLELIEIDALTPDFHVCAEDGTILGAPTIYIAIDVATEMVIGIWAYLQAPGVEPLMDFCSRAFFPKAPRKNGVQVPWGCPEKVLSDQGAEFLSAFWAAAGVKLMFAIVIAEGEAGWKKPMIERFNGEIQERYLWRIRGTTRNEQTGKTDPSLVNRSGTLTLAQLNEQLEVFAYDIHPTLVSERLSIKHNTPQMTPRQAWDKLTRIHPPTIPVSREDFLSTTYARFDQCKLTHAGARVLSLSYASKELFDLRDQIRGFGGDETVEVYGSPLDITDIFVKHVPTGLSARGRVKNEAVKGLSLASWKAMAKTLKLGAHKSGDDLGLNELAVLIDESNRMALSSKKMGDRRKNAKIPTSQATSLELRDSLPSPTVVVAARTVDEPGLTQASPSSSAPAPAPAAPAATPSAPRPRGKTQVVRLSDLDEQ